MSMFKPKVAITPGQKGQGPRNLLRIDRPHGQPGAQWHAHGKGGAINLDGTVKEGSADWITSGIRAFLKNAGWNL